MLDKKLKAVSCGETKIKREKEKEKWVEDNRHVKVAVEVFELMWIRLTQKPGAWYELQVDVTDFSSSPLLFLYSVV